VSDPRTGGCLCGAIRYEIVGELSSPYAVIAATANARVVPRTSPPRAFLVQGFASSKAHQSATL
jgi:hypothetical protein